MTSNASRWSVVRARVRPPWLEPSRRELGARHIELDSLYHQPDWTPLADEEFRLRVDEATGDGRWVVDGNYSAIREIVWDRADTVVWFDLPYATVLARTIRRTLRRTLTREELWNGNREPLSNLWSLQPREVDHRLDRDPSQGVPKALHGRRREPAVGPPALRPPGLAA